jgi:hypothetical protein
MKRNLKNEAKPGLPFYIPNIGDEWRMEKELIFKNNESKIGTWSPDKSVPFPYSLLSQTTSISLNVIIVDLVRIEELGSRQEEEMCYDIGTWRYVQRNNVELLYFFDCYIEHLIQEMQGKIDQICEKVLNGIEELMNIGGQRHLTQDQIESQLKISEGIVTQAYKEMKDISDLISKRIDFMGLGNFVMMKKRL